MADDAKRDVLPTMPGRGGPTERSEMPSGMPTQTVRDVVPVQATLVPLTDAGASAQIGAPPEMPAEDRYQLGTEIARGGMGRVVEATDTMLGRTVALKVALALDADSVRRFQRETRITARLEHPAIIPVHDAGIGPGGAPFYVMRKVSGRPLEQLVAEKPELADRLALLPSIVAASHAVAHAHSRGIVHRDIKPANILVGDNGETIVIDWGIAKAMGEPEDRPAHPIQVEDTVHTRAGLVYGTPGFMSAEQLRGAPADERSDVYALGGTLYHLLARRPPHAAKSGDEMMRAAVEGPPTPIRELAPGVPPELATIVDKALAFDARVRYQNAGALAEDLQRFLAGQLVASHHYSASEKLVRFIKRNRATVGVTVAAALALIVGGTIAIRRVVAERDRADEQKRIAVAEKQEADAKRKLADDRADQLTLTEARILSETNPTLAVAMVKPLADRMWRPVRAIGAAARAQGIARGFPASPHTMSLELDAEGTRALAAGSDGVVRLYDLAHGTSREIADVKHSATAAFAGDGKVVVVDDAGLHIVDLGGGPARDVAVTTPIARLAMSGPIAYWIDRDGALWSADIANPAPERHELDDRIDLIAPSPDGRWVALAGEHGIVLLDRTQPTLPPERIVEGAARTLAWSPESDHLGALVEDEAVDYGVISHTVAQRFTVGNRTAIAYVGGRIATAGATGVALTASDAQLARKESGVFTLGLHEARGGMLVTAAPQGLIKVLSSAGTYTLRSPVQGLAALATSPRSPWVIGAVDGLLLEWNLDQIQPRRVIAGLASTAEFVDGDHLIVTYPDAPAEWIDLPTGKRRPLGEIIPGLAAVVSSQSRDRALVLDGTHHARFIPASGAPVDVEGEIDHAAFFDGEHAVLATHGGALRLEDGNVLTARHATVDALAGGAGWIAAAYSDRTLWRGRPGGSEATLTLDANVPRRALAITSDGTAVFAAGNAVRAWRPDGKLTTLFELGHAVTTIHEVEHGRLVALAAGGGVSVFSLDGKHEDSPLDLNAAAPLTDDGVRASFSAGGALEAADVVAQETWIVAAAQPGQTFLFHHISPDGKRIVAVAPDGVYVWTLDLPHDADDTTDWLDGMTNALAEQGPRSLTWK